MKKFSIKALLMAAVLPLAVTFSSCSDDDNDGPALPEISINDDDKTVDLTFAHNAGAEDKQTVELKSNVSWEAAISGNGSEWISVTPSSGGKTDGRTITIAMKSANTTTTTRTANISFKAKNGVGGVTVKVSQLLDDSGIDSEPISKLVALAAEHGLEVNDNTGSYTIEEDFLIKAVIVNEPQTANAGLGQKAIFIADNETGINIIAATKDHGLVKGDMITFNVKGGSMKYFNKGLQVNIPTINKVASGQPIPYKTATLKDITDGKYVGMAVKIENVQFTDLSVGKDIAGDNNVSLDLIDKDGNTAVVYTNKNAKAAFAGLTAPSGSGTFYGVAGMFNSPQLYLTGESDYAEMTGTRFDVDTPDGGIITTLPYVVDFEAEEFVASTVYNNTSIKYFGAEPYQWGTYYGTVATTASINSKSMQMRWYTTAPGNLGYTFTNFEVKGVGTIKFSAKWGHGLDKPATANVKVYHSTDKGATWSTGEIFTLTGEAAEYSYKVTDNAAGETIQAKFEISLPTPVPSQHAYLIIDDVQFLAPGQTSAPIFGVPSLTASAPAAGGNVNIAVTGNVDWYANVLSGAEFLNGATTPIGGGNGAGTVTLNLKENTSTTDTREVKVKVLTTADVATKEYTVVITQAKASSGGGPSGSNLVVNNSFEDYTDNVPASWTIGGGAALEKITSSAQEGSTAVKISGSGSTGRLEQVIPVEVGATYTISFWYRSNTKGTATQGFRIWSGLKNGDTFWTAAELKAAGVESILQPSETFAAVGDTWTQYSVDLTIPSGVTHFNFGIRATNNNSGVVDNCSFVKK